MQFNNYTPFTALAWQHQNSNNQTFASTIARVKYDLKTNLNNNTLDLKLSKDQGELFASDVYYADVGKSSLQYPSDYVNYKKYTDIIINANAISPNNKASNTWTCGIEVYDEEQKLLIDYNLDIKSEVKYTKALLGRNKEKEAKTLSVPIRYEKAFGGIIQKKSKNDEEEYIYTNGYNPIGCGKHKRKNISKITYDEQILYKDDHKQKDRIPAGFGAIDKSWKSRLKYAGTYDDKWQKNQYPLPPKDYNDMFNQSSHPNLMLNTHLKDNTKIILKNLIPNISFCTIYIPTLPIINKINTYTGNIYNKMNIDTVLIDIDKEDNYSLYISYRKQVELLEENSISEVFMLDLI